MTIQNKNKKEVSNKFEWYVIRVYSGFENQVKKNIEDKINEESHLKHKFGKIIVPLENNSEKKNGKVRKKKKKFPGYILIQMELDNETIYLTKNTAKVIGFIGEKNKPLKLKKHEIDKILKKPSKKKNNVYFKNDKVIITKGPFENIKGTIEKINKKGKIKVLANVFNRKISITIDEKNIKKI